MTHRLLCFGLGFLALAAPAPALALDKLARMILQELTCEAPPSSVRILTLLRNEGRIDPGQNQGFDSLSCFAISGGVSIAGLTFTSVCAYEEDPATQAAHPDLYWRGPGTSPGQTLSFGTPATAEVAADWYLSVFGPARINSAVAGGTLPGEAGSVSCTASMQ